MKRFMLVGSVVVLFGTPAFADGQFWVVGNNAVNRCQIVTSNPVVAGDIWFEDGPYKSKDDAKLARSGINECPQTPDPDEDKADKK
jgi:hypothetical protein